jgi:putative ABC transport system permease protein
MGLLVTAGLFTKSLLNLSRVELGMRVSGVTTFGLSPELNGHSPYQSEGLFDRVRQRVIALPGVTSVTVSTTPVLARVAGGTNVSVEGFSPSPDADTCYSTWRDTTPS